MEKHKLMTGIGFLGIFAALAIVQTTFLGNNEMTNATECKAESQAEIQWHDWGPEAFAKARSEDKLVLLDITAAWCHWCHVMDMTSYSDESVIAAINDRFIPIRVDADKYPHVSEQYLMGGWPTTAVLTPEGKTMTGGTYIPPGELLELLEQADDYYRNRRDEIDAKLAEFEKRLRQAGKIDTENGGFSVSFVKSAIDRIESLYDVENGGFGRSPKFPVPEAVQLSLSLSTIYKKPSLEKHALTTLDKMTGIYDPVWGGFFRYATDEAWSVPHYEKLLSGNGLLIASYVAGHRATGEKRYLDVARGIAGYLEQFLSDQENGGFFGSQDADIFTEGDHTAFVDGQDYFKLDDEERRAIGVPRIDRSIYADANGDAIRGYLELYKVTGEDGYLDFARRSADRIIASGVDQGGAVRHDITSAGDSPAGLLADQVRFGLALVAAYQVTGERRYLDTAERIAAFINDKLWDEEYGGLLSAPLESYSFVSPLMRGKSQVENGGAALLFTRLHNLTYQEDYRDAALRVLRYLRGINPAWGPHDASAIMALHLDLSPPASLVLVSDPAQDGRDQMLQAVWKLNETEYVLHLLNADSSGLKLNGLEYPESDVPTMYICRGRVCSPPITDPAEIRRVLAEFAELDEKPRG